MAKFFLTKFAWDHESYEHCKGRYLILKSKIEQCNIDIQFRDKCILEIGAGNSIGLGYFFLKENYKNWIASDLDRNPNERLKVARKEYSFAKRIFGEEETKMQEFLIFKDNKVQFPNKFNFINLDICKLNEGLVNKFNMIISIAVLEHLRKEEGEFIAKPGL